MTQKKIKSKKYTDFIKAAIIVALIGLVIRVFILMPYRIDSNFMENSLFEGDFVLVSKLSYKFDKPETGDIIVFEHPFKIGKLMSGRIIADEGKIVEITNKVVYVNDEQFTGSANIKYSDSTIIHEDYSNRDYSRPVNVPVGAVYVLCDNRDKAEDSRNFGTVECENIKGRALFVYWSWKPDPDAPEWKSPYIFPAIKILFYNLTHFPSRIGWNRLGSAVE